MKTIAVVNHRRRSGRTTAVHNLAYAKIKAGKKVLLVDLDPQAELTARCGLKESGDAFGSGYAAMLFTGETPPKQCAYRVTDAPPGSLYLIPAREELALVTQRHNDGAVFKDSLLRLAAYFDYCFIDCEPRLGTIMDSALLTADTVIVPIRITGDTMHELDIVLHAVEKARYGDEAALNPDLSLSGIIVTMYDSSAMQRKMIRRLCNSVNLLGTIKYSEKAEQIGDGDTVMLSQYGQDMIRSYLDIAIEI